jgi:hypothetical protein
VSDDTASLGAALDFDRRFGEPLQAILTRVSAAWPLPGDALRGSAVAEVVEQVSAVFGTPLYGVLAAGWSTFEECRAFSDPRQYPPDQVNAVPLAERTVRWGCAPTVEVQADGPAGTGVTVAEVAFRVEVEVTVRGGVLAIQGGRFLRVDAARLDVSGSLYVEDFIVASYETALKVPGSLRFGETGIPIDPTRASAAPPDKVSIPAILDATAAQV